MIYLMEPKGGMQNLPNFDYGRNRYGGEYSEFEHWDAVSRERDPQGFQPIMPSFTRCERIPEEITWRIPREIYHDTRKQWKLLPDISQHAVSERFHDLLEKMDPGGHQFFPVDIIHRKSGEKYANQGQFYLWNPLNKVCPQDLFDYPSLEAKGLLKVTRFGEREHKLYQIMSPSYGGPGIGFRYTDYTCRRKAFGSRHVVYCLPCGTNTQHEDVHSHSLWPLVTHEFMTAALALGVTSQKFKPFTTIDEA